MPEDGALCAFSVFENIGARAERTLISRRSKTVKAQERKPRTQWALQKAVVL